MKTPSLSSSKQIENKILLLRGHKVLLDSDLAVLYGVSTKRFNEAIRRNRARFPLDFMFQLSESEDQNLRSQIATSSSTTHGGRRYRPYAFTEHGALMAASVLNSTRAVETSILIVRTFVRLRKMLQSHTELTRKLNALETKYDAQFRVVFDAIRELMEPPAKEKRKIGFGV